MADLDDVLTLVFRRTEPLVVLVRPVPAGLDGPHTITPDVLVAALLAAPHLAEPGPLDVGGCVQYATGVEALRRAAESPTAPSIVVAQLDKRPGRERDALLRRLWAQDVTLVLIGAVNEDLTAAMGLDPTDPDAPLRWVDLADIRRAPGGAHLLR